MLIKDPKEFFHESKQKKRKYDDVIDAFDVTKSGIMCEININTKKIALNKITKEQETEA